MTTTLLCLPFAGAGASVFSPWVAMAKGRTDVTPLQLPGREERFVEEPFTSVAAAVAGLVDDATRAVAESERIALFGHSLGAVLAFELAVRLEQEGLCPARLVVSGSPGPWNGRTERATGLDDDAFIRQVQQFAGYEHPALAHRELRELLLPTLRADVQMHEDYTAAPDTCVAAPIVSLRGSDDQLVSAADALQWKAATSSTFEYLEMPGSHMYLTDDVERVLDVVAGPFDTLTAR